VLAAVGTLFAAFFILVAPMAKAAGTIFVSPSGSDSAAGASASSAKKTLQGALDAASSGTTIQLAAGRYAGTNVHTRSAGVTITGPAGAIVAGTGDSRVLEINHDDTTLKGFTIDGGGRLIFVIGTKAGDGVSGTRIEGMTLKNAQGECIRLKYLATNSVINGNTIGPCGLEDFQGGGGGKNGEGVYIGTAPEQNGEFGAPDNRDDVSKNNVVSNNRFDTQGNECVDIKESSTANLVEHNLCTGQKDPNSGGMDSRGPGNTFRANIIQNNVGAGIRVGGDAAGDAKGNNIVNNVLKGNDFGALKIKDTPGTICGNTNEGNGSGEGTPSGAFNACPSGVETGGTPGPTSGNQPSSLPTASPSPDPSASPSPQPSASPSPEPSASPSPSPSPAPGDEGEDADDPDDPDDPDDADDPDDPDDPDTQDVDDEDADDEDAEECDTEADEGDDEAEDEDIEVVDDEDADDEDSEECDDEGDDQGMTKATTRTPRRVTTTAAPRPAR
jgi:hypothetical protein